VQLTACRYSVLSLQPPPVVPLGGVAIWDVTAPVGCPVDGFAPLTSGSDGRLLAIGGINSTFSFSSNVPIEPGDDVTSHSHAFSSSITLGATDFAGIAGCCDDKIAGDGTTDFSGTSSIGSSSMPYAAVLACNATATSSNALAAPPFLPQGGILLLATENALCPQGWVPLSQTLAGRFPIGTPPHGIPSRVFGGVPMTAGESPSWVPTHAHEWSASIDLNPAGVALDSGCCAHNYGSAGKYPANGVTGSPNLSPPWVILPACVVST